MIQRRPGSPPICPQELIERLNSLLGEATPLDDQAAFVNQLAGSIRTNPTVMDQVENNLKDHSMKGSLPGAVESGVVRAMPPHNTLARLLLGKDKQALPILHGIIYDILKQNQDLQILGHP